MSKLYLDITETSYRRLSNIPGLDGVRAISILIVMVSHSGLQTLVPGVLGVTIFFFLSGFLITSLLFDEYSQTGRLNIWQFYVRRFLRLYPPLLIYIIIVIIVLTCFSKKVDVVGLLGALFYFANYLLALAPNHIWSFGAQLWSLSVEEHFYIFFPLLLSLVMRYDGTTIVRGLAIITLGPLLTRAFIVLTTNPSEYITYTTVATECRFDSILFGCITAIAIRQQWGSRLIQRGSHPISVFAALIAMALTLTVRDVTFRQTMRFTIQDFALVPLFLSAVYTPRFMFAKRILNNPLMRWIGVLSYSLYLWHVAAFEAARYLVQTDNPILLHLLGWASSFAIALLVHVGIERPLFQVRRRFGSRAHEDLDRSKHENQKQSILEARRHSWKPIWKPPALRARRRG